MEITDCETDKNKEVAEVENPPPEVPFLPCVPKGGGDLKPILPPDHPLLQRFQQTLKEHLLRVKNQIGEEIDTIKHQIKVKDHEREVFGVKLYDLQNEINKQIETLEGYSANIRDTVNKRIECEEMRDTLRDEYNAQAEYTKDQKLLYNQRMVELNHLQNLENNIRQWTEEHELELITSKRVVSKDAQLQKEKADEKAKADMMAFNLQVSIKKREDELAGIMKQLGELREINNSLNASLTDANTDLEILQQEHKRLNQAWGEVIIAIGHRDKVLFGARKTLEQQLEEYKLTCASIEAVKKQIGKATEEHEKLDAFKTRLHNDLLGVNRDIKKKEKILLKLDTQMEELPKILEQTEKDYAEAKRECNQLSDQLKTLQFKLDRQYRVKFTIEDSILKLAQEQLLCDKASVYRLKVLEEHQHIRRTMEDNMLKVENQLATCITNLEQQKLINRGLQEELDSLVAKFQEINVELDEIFEETKEVRKQITIKLRQVEKLTKELDILLKEAQGCELSPTELKIKTLESSIQDTEKKIRDHQQFWLILQGHIIHLSEKRNRQLNDIQIARKQLMIITQKSLKIDGEIEKAEVSENEIYREIQNFGTKLELISAKCFEKRKHHEVNEIECNLEHREVLDKLRDNEIKVLQIEQEIIDLQEEIENYNQMVLERHREALSWETKYKLLDQTLRWRRDESTTESEIGTMKAEIHRMQIRYKELKRAQEKLIQDLDHCVMHRERIFVVATTRQKMEYVQFRSRTNLQQRINDVQTKMKQVQVELGVAHKKYSGLLQQHLDSDESKKQLDMKLNTETNENQLIENQIQHGLLMKQQNLDNIVRKQRRAKEYRRLELSPYPYKMVPSDTSLDAEEVKQSEINYHLIEVVETMLVNFPKQIFVLTRIKNVLKD